MKKKTGFVLCFVLTILVSTSFINAQASKTKLEFYQKKREAVEVFDKLIAKFEKENPGIEIVQNFNQETVLKARMVKNDLPDIISMDGNVVYSELAGSGMLYDFTKASLLKKVQKPYIDVLKELAQKDNVYGIPYTANASTIIYNKEKFEKLGLKIPKTWDELIAMSEKIKKAGEVPFYLTLKDSWTVMCPYNSLAASIQGDDFIAKRKKGTITFKERHREIANKMLLLLNYGHDDNFGVNYDQGNTAFANGKSVMLIQGIWAIGAIKKQNPDIKLGVFNLPATNTPSKNKLVSGVDSVICLAKKNKDMSASKKFLQFLLKEENAKFYIDDQKLYSAVKGVFQNDPELKDLKEYFESGRLADFPDHYYPSAMQVSNLAQELLVKKDVNKFLQTMDEEWNKVNSR
jgi:raffinose/stachyose/melibiose transport system substrate-binding protein